MNIVRTLKKIAPSLSFILLFVFCTPSYAREEKYCVASLPCPVLNTPDFRSVLGGRDGKTVKVDQKGLIRELEFIALPGTLFEIIDETKKESYSILKVKTSEYPSSIPLFIDSRFVRFSRECPPEREKYIYSQNRIISSMASMKGHPYMWGGNYVDGIRQLPEFYPPSGKISPKMLSLWRLEGVDCSGLIYQASGGYTPRNTSSMLFFGERVEILGLSAEEIALKVKPLDLIVWQGHVVIVLSSDTTIESTHPEGVIVSALVPRLKKIMAERTPANIHSKNSKKTFVIRRWHRFGQKTGF